MQLIHTDPAFRGVHMSVGLSNFTVMLPPKRGDGVVIRVLVSGQIAEGHIVMGGAFDSAGTRHPNAIAVEQQARQE